ncbi:MAG: hypothetical protein J6V72_11035 [Kiritimatiellae bacterium]|nr:hypothetical protein [Kiritimatiellia bacterium]
MPAAIAFECEVSEQGIADFVKALSRYQKETQRDMREALRSATIDLVKSLRARTRKAPKLVPREDVRFGESDPKYITGRDGRQFRRVVISRWAKGRRVQKVHWQPVCAKYRSRRTRTGGVTESWAESKAAMLREARQRYGGIRQWGLAKKSWGWFMKSLFGKSMQDENPKALVKPSMVDGGIQEFREVLPDGTVDRSAPIRCDIDIVNRLAYIRKAMPPGVLAIAVQKATNLINHKIGAGLRSRKFGN